MLFDLKIFAVKTAIDSTGLFMVIICQLEIKTHLNPLSSKKSVQKSIVKVT